MNKLQHKILLIIDLNKCFTTMVVMDLMARRQKLEEEIQASLGRMDQLLTQPFDTELEESFDEEERGIARLVADFQEVTESETDDPELLLSAKELPQIFDKLVIKRRAELLTRWYQHQTFQLREAGIRDLERVFVSNNMQKNIRLFHATLKKLDQCMVSTQGLQNTALYQAMVARGKILEVKEGLILAFTDYEEVLANEFAHMHTPSHLPEKDILFSQREKECQKLQKIGEALMAEGLALQRSAGELIHEDTLHYGELFKQGNHLAEIGKKLQHKALLASEKLHKLWQRPH